MDNWKKNNNWKRITLNRLIDRYPNLRKVRGDRYEVANDIAFMTKGGLFKHQLIIIKEGNIIKKVAYVKKTESMRKRGEKMKIKK